jgi:hypothetical protein
LADLQASGLQPAPIAAPETLLRRLKFDLLGLPPEPEEVQAFVNATNSGTATHVYEQWVDAYLASPRFGERWAQVWLDLARYAETDGFEHDRVRKDAWRYRDWVVRAINADMPYDEFVSKQLMGEESERGDDQIATMFALAGPDMPDINDQELRRHDRLNEITATIGSALLGMQFQCAQCHDHKYDPISQADFYRLRAVFEPSVPTLQRDQAYTQFDRRKQRDDRGAFFYFRGEVRNVGPQVEAAAPRVLAIANDSNKQWQSHPKSAMVAWLFHRDHPLTSRVLVNRIWQSHFGRGLFENPSDVGVSAASPTHLAVLDWLAEDVQRSDWSMKAIHRRIVLSATYQQASYRVSETEAARKDWDRRRMRDPENRLYSRYPRHRLDAEVIRDAMLSVSGQMNFEMGGESVMPPLPEECIKTLLKGQWTTSERNADHVRRSIYTFARRNLRYPILDAFDRPDASASCAKRDCSTTAIQALQMLNSDLSYRCSQQLRDLVFAQSSPSKQSEKDDEAIKAMRVRNLYQRVLGRLPTEQEHGWLLSFLESSNGNESTRWLAACSALLNTSEFVYID